MLILIQIILTQQTWFLSVISVFMFILCRCLCVQGSWVHSGTEMARWMHLQLCLWEWNDWQIQVYRQVSFILPLQLYNFLCYFVVFDNIIWLCCSLMILKGSLLSPDRCAAYPALPPYCSLVQDPNDFCCKQPLCNYQTQAPSIPPPVTPSPLPGQPTPSPNVNPTPAPNPNGEFLWTNIQCNIEWKVWWCGN